LWIYAPSGQLKSDEHMCLSATRIIHTSNQWMVQLKECGEHDHEFWDYSAYVRIFRIFWFKKYEFILGLTDQK
jgi:hypothetical protein